MRVCVISSLFAPYTRGGAEVLVMRTVTELKKNHEVSVITIGPWNGFWSLFPHTTEEVGVKVTRFFPLNIFSFISIHRWPLGARLLWHAIDLFNIHSYLTVRSLLAREKPDLVLTHNLKGIGYLSVRAISSLGLNHIHTIHDTQLYTLSGLIIAGEEDTWMHTSLLARLYRIVCRWMFARVTRVISPSRYLAELMRTQGFFFKAHIAVIRNPIENNPDSSSHTASLGTKMGTKKFLTIGQIEKHKGIETLLSGFEKLEGDWTLTIIGTGSQEEISKLRTISDSRISWRGYITDRNEINAIIDDAYFFVIPTQCYENSPTVIIESLARGVPVIASDIGGTAELIEDGVNGYHVAPVRPDELTRVLTHAMALDDATYMRMQEAARNSVRGSDITQYVEKIFSQEILL